MKKIDMIKRQITKLQLKLASLSGRTYYDLDHRFRVTIDGSLVCFGGHDDGIILFSVPQEAFEGLIRWGHEMFSPVCLPGKIKEDESETKRLSEAAAKRFFDDNRDEERLNEMIIDKFYTIFTAKVAKELDYSLLDEAISKIVRQAKEIGENHENT